MFSFLESWDPILVDFKKDIDGVIKGEIRLWAVAMQTYCERLMKLFNDREKIFLDDEKITLGSCLNDRYFKELFQEKTGFHDFNSLHRLNEYGNNRKHRDSIKDAEKIEIKDWLRKLHKLSLMTYNYLNNSDYYEEFNEKEIEKNLLSSEEEFIDVIDYADNLLSRKNEIILTLENEYQDLLTFVNEDTEEILSYKREIIESKRTIQKLNSTIIDYKRLLEMFEEYILINKNKNFFVDDFMELLSNAENKLIGQIDNYCKEYRDLKKEVRRKENDIEKYISSKIEKNHIFQHDIYPPSVSSIGRDIYGNIIDYSNPLDVNYSTNENDSDETDI